MSGHISDDKILTMGETGSGEEVPISGEVLEAILAGDMPEHAVQEMQKLPPEDRQLVLCTLCAMRDEVVSNCEERGETVVQVLSRACPFYIGGERTCLS